MSEELRDRVEEVLFDQLDKFENMEAGTDEHAKMAESISKLHKVHNDELKITSDYLQEDYKATKELELRQREVESLERSKKIEAGVAIAGLAITLYNAIADRVSSKRMYHEGLKFEETNTYTVRSVDIIQRIKRLFK